MEIDTICNTDIKKAGVSISGKAYFSAKNIIWDKECNLTMIKGSMHQQDIRILNVYASSNRASECINKKVIDLQVEENKSTVIARGLNTFHQ